MEFGLSDAIQLASSSLACRRPARELVAAANWSATKFELSRHVEIARTCLRPARELIRELVYDLLSELDSA